MRRSRLIRVLLVLVLLVGGGFGGWRVADSLGFCASDFLPIDDGIQSAPYLTRVTESSVTVSWWTADPTTGSVLVTAADPAAGTAGVSADSGSSEVHHVTLDGLMPGTSYHYVVTGGVGGSGTFTTDPGPGASVTVGVIGDSGTGSSGQYAVASVLTGLHPDLVIHTGDVVYRRGARCDYPGSFFAPYGDLLSQAPIYPTYGNHDAVAAGGAAYRDVFGLPNGGPGGTDTSYVVTYGPVQFTVIDGEVLHGDDEAVIARQRSWLETTLRSVDRPWSVVVVHRPGYSTQTNTQKWDQRVRDLGSLFAETGVDLVLSGHAHNYERFQPVDGVTWVVTGGGGAGLHDVAQTADVVVSRVAYHAVELTIDPDRLVIVAIDGAGNEFDRLELDARAT